MNKKLREEIKSHLFEKREFVSDLNIREDDLYSYYTNYFDSKIKNDHITKACRYPVTESSSDSKSFLYNR